MKGNGIMMRCKVEVHGVKNEVERQRELVSMMR